MYRSLQKCYPEHVNELYEAIQERIKMFNNDQKKQKKITIDEINAILITYADTLRGEGSPLSVLTRFLKDYVGATFNVIHLLPFFDYSSDDGFSIIDYQKVNQDCGRWEDIAILSERYHLMFDAVINHISQKSEWFQGYLNGAAEYQDFFIALKGDEDLSQVTRPRTSPLSTQFQSINGQKAIWTTFSSDQIDLNYQNPKLFLRIIDTLFFYIHQGASLIRLDAVGYLWKEKGTSCIHLEQTHEIVKLIRCCLDKLIKNALVITETNVPHSDNIRYFGDGKNEAHMVYNFSLPPLVLHAYLQQSSKELSQWVNQLDYPSSDATFFNFLASHDGIGLTPLNGLVDVKEVNDIVLSCVKNGGKISYKRQVDGSQIPYELNINFFDALSDRSHDEVLNIRKFLGAHAIAIALKGIPGIYIHSLLGSKSWKKGVEQLGYNRAINREKLQIEQVLSELKAVDSTRHQIFYPLKKMLEFRTTQKSLSLKASQRVILVSEQVFILKRSFEDETIFLLVNLSDTEQVIDINEFPKSGDFQDMMNEGKTLDQLIIDPYAFLWLKQSGGE
ncbi:MAG TPA: alpha-amylase family glycosyl hydrolase [Thermotogota bacterium]|nr:alpha-amylase family glycosyl hydrolase [Thermotogota bacterium]HRW33524.1 alpha-amylase family glycosyl hydrolase [Thermotogota bacterium]